MGLLYSLIPLIFPIECKVSRGGLLYSLIPLLIFPLILFSSLANSLPSPFLALPAIRPSILRNRYDSSRFKMFAIWVREEEPSEKWNCFHSLLHRAKKACSVKLANMQDSTFVTVASTRWEALRRAAWSLTAAISARTLVNCDLRVWEALQLIAIMLPALLAPGKISTSTPFALGHNLSALHC